ncbi:MAG: membrane protein insertion efficiency factor YidD [Cyclobacteriaceae bacterium]
MKLIFSIFTFVIVSASFAQDKTVDQQLLTQAISQNAEQEKKYDGFFYGLYKNHLSRQILNDCIYDHSCSKFSHDVFKHFGVFKGLFLTADRLTRCNRAAFAELPSSRINMDGSAIDHWDHYENND